MAQRFALALTALATTAAKTVDLTHPAPPPRVAKVAAHAKAQMETLAIDLNKAALIIVDMQNYFVDAATAPGRKLVPAMNHAAAAFRAANASVFWVNWGVRPDYQDWPGRSAMGSGHWLPPAKGTHGAALFSGLRTDATDVFVDKFRETGFYRSQLDDILRFRGIRTLFFGGVNTDQCVAGTMWDAGRLGYDTALVTDLTATTSPAYAYQATLYNSQWTTTSDSLITALQEADHGAPSLAGARPLAHPTPGLELERDEGECTAIDASEPPKLMREFFQALHNHDIDHLYHNLTTADFHIYEGNVSYTKKGWFDYVRSKSGMQGSWTLSEFVVSVDHRSAHVYYDDRAMFTNTTSGATSRKHWIESAYMAVEGTRLKVSFVSSTAVSL